MNPPEPRTLPHRTLPPYTLNSIDDVDEMYSDMMGGPPRVVITPREEVWLLLIHGWEDLVMQRLTPNGDSTPGYVEPSSFGEAFELLRGGLVVTPYSAEDPGLPRLTKAFTFNREQVDALWGNTYGPAVWDNLRRSR